MRSNNRIAANCEPYNRKDVLDAKELASVPLREKKQEKLKSNQYNNKTASKLKG